MGVMIYLMFLQEFVPLIGVMIYLFFCISPDLGHILNYSFMYCQSIVKTSGNPYAVYVIVINKCFLATGLPVSQVKLTLVWCYLLF